MKPSESLAEEENVTNNGLLPEVGVAAILTDGAAFGFGVGAGVGVGVGVGGAGVGVGVGVGGGGAGAPPRVLCRTVPSFLRKPGDVKRNAYEEITI